MYEETSYNWRGKDGTRIRVGVEPSHTLANVCRFVVDPPIYPDGAVHFADQGKTAYSPLAKKLLDLDDVAEVLIAGDSVTVTTESHADWESLAPKIAEAIRIQIDSGDPCVTEEHKKSLPSPDVIREKVQTLIDTAINPAISSHGGSVTLVNVIDNNVVLEFGGGCQGCGMAHVTLKYGVERLIREHVPEVGQVLDTTDHASGENPYYSRSS
ncbi:MAG: NifU family protein [Candidatus Latescibacterota bacterium]|nr:MAG: NifU family protein [Candidatus Latescibacterota bacterium]